MALLQNVRYIQVTKVLEHHSDVLCVSVFPKADSSIESRAELKDARWTELEKLLPRMGNQDG